MNIKLGQIVLDEKGEVYVYYGARETSVGSLEHHFVRAMRLKDRGAPPWTYKASNEETLRRKFPDLEK
jgi:hypothetical protein